MARVWLKPSLRLADRLAESDQEPLWVVVDLARDTGALVRARVARDEPSNSRSQMVNTVPKLFWVVAGR